MTELEVDQCLAELLYLKRSIDVQIQFADADRSLKMMDENILNKTANKTDLLIIKYYVKSLIKHDEFQLGVEAKTGYKQLLNAQRLDKTVLVAQHQHKKETIKI